MQLEEIHGVSRCAKPMRVLHVITGLNIGGAETVLCRLLETLRAPTFEHTVVSLGGEAELGGRVREAGAALICLDMRPGHPNPWALWRLRRMLRMERPDVIHAWMYHANVAATLAAFGVGVPLLWGIRHSLYRLQREKVGSRIIIRVSRVLSGRPTRIVYNSFISEAQHEAFGFKSERSLVIPNGFDVEQFHADSEVRARVRTELSIAAGDLAIGLIARWHAIKDHVNFLRAAALLAQLRPAAIFVLVGNGLDANNADLMAIINSLDLANRVRLCGRRSDMPAINVALDIASSSSWGEAFPNVIGEAMACEVLCVATDVGDAREIIGDTGIVVPPRDPEALCRGWEELARLAESERRAWGKRARDRILERYSLTSMAARYAEIYADVAWKH